MSPSASVCLLSSTYFAISPEGSQNQNHWACETTHGLVNARAREPSRNTSSRRGGSGAGCDGGPCLVEVEELTVQAAVLVEVAAGNLDPSRVGHAAHVERVEAGHADQPFDRRRRGVVIGGVEQHCPPRVAVRGACERV